MFLTVHATFGIIVGQTTGNYWLAFGLGIISHFLLDIIPHGDNAIIADKNSISQKNKNTIIKLATVDSLVLGIIIGILYYFNLITFTWPMIAGIIGGILPDAITGIYLFISQNKWLKKYFDFHYYLHLILKKFETSFTIGLIIQTIIMVIFLSIIL